MVFEIGGVADMVLPESPLPHASSPGFAGKFADPGFFATGKQPLSCEMGLDLTDSGGKIGITWRQCPYHVQVIGHQNDGGHFERSCRSTSVDGLPERVHSLSIRQNRSPVGRDDR
jgi:hypothetical protein